MQRIKDMGIVITKLPNGLPLLFMNSSHVIINNFFILNYLSFVLNFICIFCYIILGK